MIVNTQAILEGKSHKGKNLIRENGPLWVVYARTDKVLWQPEPGPWLYVYPVGKDHLAKEARWIKEVDDVDLKLVSLVP